MVGLRPFSYGKVRGVAAGYILVHIGSSFVYFRAASASLVGVLSIIGGNGFLVVVLFRILNTSKIDFLFFMGEENLFLGLLSIFPKPSIN